MNAQIEQLLSLVRKGNDVKDAAEMLGMDVDAATMALAGAKKEVVTLDELVNNWKPTGVRILMELAESYDVEPRDRIAAAKILLSGEGVVPNVNANDMTRRLENMRRAMGNVVESTPSPKLNKPPVIDINDMKNQCFELAAA